MKTLFSISTFLLLSVLATGQTSYGQYNVSKKSSAKSLIYPNPTFDSFSIKNDSEVDEISIFNIVGKKVLTESHITGEEHKVSELKRGIYLVRLLNEDDEVLQVIRLTKK